MNHIKHPVTEHPILENIKLRWSPRAFEEKQIDEQTMKSLFEAARWSASAINEQPWQYYYAHRGSAGFEKIVAALAPGNEPWAKYASVLIVASGRKTYAANGAPNVFFAHDLGMANANLMHQAIAYGINSHPMGGFDKSKIIESLQLTDNEEPVCVIALGYTGQAENLPEPYKSRELTPRQRKPITEFTKAI